MNLRLSNPHHIPRRSVVALLLVGFFCWSAGAEEIDNASARAFNAAAALQNAGLHTRATAKWNEFIAAYPEDARIGRANYYLGVCRLREKKFKEAADTFQAVLARWPEFGSADKAQYNLAMSRYELATAAKNADGFRQAAKDFELVTTKYGSSDLVDRALYYQGDSLFNAGDFAAAVPAYQKLIAEHADSPQAARGQYDLGLALEALGKTAEAAVAFKSFLENPAHASHELSAEIRLRWAICLRELDQLEPAAAQFKTVSEIADFELSDYAALRLGQTRLEQKKYAEAANTLQQFSNKFPGSRYRGEALKTAGQCFYLADKPQDAMRILPELARGNDPAAAEAAYWLGRSQLQINQANQALASLDAAIGRFGNDPFLPYLKFARIDALYEIPARRKETPALYEGFMREYPDHKLASRATYMAAFSAFGQQLYPKAREIAAAYLDKGETASSPFAPDLHYIAAESYLLETPDDEGARTKAEALYRALVSNFPEHERAARSHLRIGWCLHAADKYQDAINYLSGAQAKFDKQQQLPEALLWIGRSQAKLNQHAAAVTAFDQAIAANGNWENIDQVLLAKAESQRAINQNAPAAETLQQLVSTQPTSNLRGQALYWLGELAQQNDKLDQAINFFQEVAEKTPQTELAGPATHAVAALLFAKADYPQSRAWATRLIDGQPGDELSRRGRYLRGIAYHREKDYAKALADLNLYRSKPVDEKESVNATYVAALCNIHQNQFDPARQLLDELLNKQPDFDGADQAYYELGHGLREQPDKGAAAAAAFRWIADNRPDSKLAAESWFRIGQYHANAAAAAAAEAKAMELTTAEAAFVSGLKKATEPGLRENMQYLLGDLQFRQQRYEDAAQTLTGQVSEFGNGKYTGPAIFLAAQARYELKQFDQALPLFIKIADVPFPDTQAEQIEAYRSQAAYRAGDCAAKLKQWAASQQHFQRVIDQFPNFAERAAARYGLAYALQQQNQIDKAISVYEQVTTETETETAAKARFMIGEIEFGRKRFENAIEQFLIVTVGYPYEDWQALARFETARCFRELGDDPRAVKALREMIEKHPNHARTADAKKMLAELGQ